MMIGFSGHQHIGDDATRNWLEAVIQREILKSGCDIGSCSLAVGSDQLFARCLLRLGKRLEVIVPCDGYEATFKEDANLQQYKQMLAQANSVVKLSEFREPSEEAFLAAGMTIVGLSDLMFFVWNEKPARGLGGTGDVVAYARKVGVSLRIFNPVDHTEHIE